MHRLARIGAVMLTVGVLVAASCTAQTSPPSTAAPTSTVARPDVPTTEPTSSATTSITGRDATSDTTIADERQIVVYLDGWSAANLDTVAGTWQPDGDAAANVVAAAADTDDISAADPRAVTQLAARLVTSDPTLVCGTAGCETATRQIEYETLIRPGDVAGFGAVYRTRHIDTGVWVFRLPGTAGTFTVGDDTMTLTSDGGDQLDRLDGPSNGWGQGQYALGYAFGRLFALDAGWLRYDTDGTTSYAPPAPASGSPVADFDPTDLTHGLGAPLEHGLAAGMTDQLLTYITSPTTGCYVAVLCVPGVATPTVTVGDVHTVDVCDTDLHTATVTLAGVDITFDYTAPTHQFGMWNTATADGVFPDGHGSNLWASDPPLIEGPSVQHHAVAVLVDAAGIAAITGGSFQVGVDSPDYDRFIWTVDDIPRLFDGWEPCR